MLNASYGKQILREKRIEHERKLKDRMICHTYETIWDSSQTKWIICRTRL